MNRADIWLIDLGSRIGKRPVVILTRQNVIEYLNKVTVAEISTQGKGYPTEVYLDHKGNLPKASFVHTDNLHTVAKAKLEKYVGTLDPEIMREISQKIILSLGLETGTGED